MWESRKQKLLPFRKFIRRIGISLALTGTILAIALFFGMLGYHFIGGFGWVDSFLEASMILTGMGPVGQLKSNGAKIFASLYALFSGVVFLTCIAVTLAPVLHRILHKFHIDEDDLKKSR
jgi:hypothetical protein